MNKSGEDEIKTSKFGMQTFGCTQTMNKRRVDLRTFARRFSAGESFFSGTSCASSKVSARRILSIDQVKQSQQRLLIAIDDLLGPYFFAYLEKAERVSEILLSAKRAHQPMHNASC